jgi:hypothetical protein
VTAAGKLVLAFLIGSAMAQQQQRTISARAGTINYQQGAVYVDDQRLHYSYRVAHPFQMNNGQRLHVDNGRVELQLGSGVYLRMLGASSIRMQETQLADTRVLVEDGSALIEVEGMNKDAQLRVICGEVSTELKHDGSYRFDAPMEATPGRLRVYSGDAVVERQSIAVKARSGLAVELGHGLELSKFDLQDGDALQAWAARRSQRRIDNERRLVETRAMQKAKKKAEWEAH